MLGSFKGKLVFKTKNTIFLENQFGLCELYLNNVDKFENQNEYHMYYFQYKNNKNVEIVTNFGFNTIEETYEFYKLMQIDNVGPKTALKIMSRGIDSFYESINNNEIEILVNNYKINPKTAQKIISYYDKENKSEFTNLQIRKINAAIAHLQKIGYSKEISTKIVWNRQKEVIDNDFSKIFFLLIQDIKNERINS